MNTTIHLHLNTPALRLSDTLTATLTIDGTAPLTVTLSQPLLSDAGMIAWRIVPHGPATATKLLDGQERWTQVYDLHPYALGDVPVTFAPITVTAGATATTLAAPTQTVAVTTTISDANAPLRPPAGPESLPPIANSAETPFGGIFLLLAVAVIVLAAVRSRWQRPRPTPHPVEIAMTKLAAMDSEAASFSDDLAALIRQFQQDDTGQPWSTRTTDEIAAGESDPAILAVLRQCDGERFANVPLSREARAAMREEVMQFLTARLPNQGRNLTST